MSESATDRSSVILCADDYAIADGVSCGIRELIAAARLTATSAIVTLPRWPADADLIRPLRGRVSIGLHLNLTLGAPLTAMPGLAPTGSLPTVGRLAAMALTGRLDHTEILMEISRQLEAFVAAMGHPPDHIDGHQHVHALPTVRTALFEALEGDKSFASILIRDPSDAPSRFLSRGQPTKALGVAALSFGFGKAARKRGYATNDGFSGFSRFDTGHDYGAELRLAMQAPGPMHMVMCHPGYVDEDLRLRDPVVERRSQELAAISRMPGLSDLIMRIDRAEDGPPVVWPRHRQ